MVTIAPPRIGFGRQLITFGRHYLEMCIAMCAVGVPLTLGVFGVVSQVAGGGVRELYPDFALLLLALTLTLPMSAWMLFRGMSWRMTLEMAGAAFAVAVLLIAGAATGVLGQSALALTVGQFCGLSCAAMLGVMLFRLDVYTGRAPHHMTHAADRS